MSSNNQEKKERQTRQIRRKEKSKVGIAYVNLITKRKTHSFGRFTKQNKKYLQIKSPLEGKCTYIIDFSQSMEKKSIISTSPPLHFPKITFNSCAHPLKTQKKNPHIPSLLSSQITQTLKTSKPKLNLA
jgi:hypothetical protein